MADVDNFLGMRATTDFKVEGQRPQSWREGILYLYPNGMAPLTALTNLMGSSSVSDPNFHWFSQELSEQAAAVTGIYSNNTLATPVTAALADGDTVFVKTNAKDARNFVVGKVVLFRNENSVEFDVTGVVSAPVVQAGDSSYVTVEMRQASPAGFLTTSANIQRLLVIGSAYAEGGDIPDAISQDPIHWQNCTQIFRNSLDLTRTAQKTRLRTGPAYDKAKKEALEMHSIEMEKAFLFGTPSERPGPNGKPLRTTMGVIEAVRRHGLINSFLSSPDVAPGSTWLQGGMEYLDYTLEHVFRYGSQDKLCFCGNGAMLALNQLARAHGQWQFTPESSKYGIDVTKWVTPFGNLTLKTHPLFSHEPTNRNSMLIFEPKQLQYRYITDTTFYKDDGEHGGNRKDGKVEEYLTEAGLEFHHVKGFAFLQGIGKNRTDTKAIQTAVSAKI